MIKTALNHNIMLAERNDASKRVSDDDVKRL